MTHRKRLRRAAGTTTVGAMVLIATTALIGVVFLGYHGTLTGNVIKSLVPEWNVEDDNPAQSDQDDDWMPSPSPDTPDPAGAGGGTESDGG